MAPNCCQHLGATYFVKGVGEVHLEKPLPIGWDLRVVEDGVCRVNGGLRPSFNPDSQLMGSQIFGSVGSGLFGNAF